MEVLWVRSQVELEHPDTDGTTNTPPEDMEIIDESETLEVPEIETGPQWNT